MLRGVRWSVAGCFALALAGCQTVGEPASDEPIAIETAALAANELNRLGRQDLDSGNYGLAERHFREAVERNGDDSASWTGLAAAYDNLGRFELADRAYTQVRRLDGETFSLLNNVGYSYFLRGDAARALVQFRRALVLFPDNPIVLNNIRLVTTRSRPTRGVAP